MAPINLCTAVLVRHCRPLDTLEDKERQGRARVGLADETGYHRGSTGYAIVDRVHHVQSSADTGHEQVLRAGWLVHSVARRVPASAHPHPPSRRHQNATSPAVSLDIRHRLIEVHPVVDLVEIYHTRHQ